MRVGWIGLGQMGAPMAGRLLAAGHRLIGQARRPGEHQALAAAGATLTPSARVVAAAQLLCVCLFDDDQVRDTLLIQGALAALKPGAVLVLHTTGDPHLPQILADAAPAGVSVLDAPFSRTAALASRGELTLLLGGDAAAVEHARPVLAALAHSILHVGPLGSGRTLKLINNLLFAAHLSLAAEALDAAEALGLSREVAARALGQCSAASYAMAKFVGVASPDELLARLRPYVDKDVDLARQALSQANIDLSLAATALWGAASIPDARP